MKETVTLIPKEREAAIEAAPDCLVIRGALADYFEEQGETLAADCLRWTVEKKRCAETIGGYPAWSSFEFSNCVADILPTSLLYGVSSLNYSRVTFVDAFNRLLIAWQAATEEDRFAWWRWNP